MPDLDSGHIFLTTLAPIKQDMTLGQDGSSHTQQARVALARMPTALQSPATIKTGINSPFARNKRNHFARMFVLNDPVFNGRIGKNALSAAITKDDPLVPQKVDNLNASYLVFCADIDAVKSDGQTLPAQLTAGEQKGVRAAYARELWKTMEDELRDIYSNCYGFEQVNSADDFATYLDKCHVETTMPFHDYYLELPKFHHLPLKLLLTVVCVPAIIALVALIIRLLGGLEMPFLGWNTLGTFIIASALTAIAAFLAIKFAIANGERPLPPGKYDDLPSVLKALYMQQKFSDFVIDQQGSSAAALHASFEEFLKTNKPSDTREPTQPPGVLSTALAETL